MKHPIPALFFITAILALAAIVSLRFAALIGLPAALTVARFRKPLWRKV